MSGTKYRQLDAKYQDLMSRSTSMRRFGYVASADALLRSAFSYAEQRDAIAFYDLPGVHTGMQQPKGRANA
jgi:hypothetical protein